MLNVAIEEISKACASSALMLAVHELGTLPIKLFGSDEQKQRILPRCATGEWIAGLRAVGAGRRLRPGRHAHHGGPDGDEWVINGTKNWITNPASPTSTSCSPSPTASRPAASRAFIVEADRPGFCVGKLEHKMGIKGSPTGPPVFEDVRVPQRT